jgi:hypothetical protein
VSFPRRVIDTTVSIMTKRSLPLVATGWGTRGLLMICSEHHPPTLCRTSKDDGFCQANGPLDDTKSMNLENTTEWSALK